MEYKKSFKVNNVEIAYVKDCVYLEKTRGEVDWTRLDVQRCDEIESNAH